MARTVILDQELFFRCRSALREHFAGGPQLYPDSAWVLCYCPAGFNGFRGNATGAFLIASHSINPLHIPVAYRDDPATIAMLASHSGEMAQPATC